MSTDLATRRKHLVDCQIRARGIRDPPVLAAMTTVPREAFLPPALAEFAYDDRPLPIAAGQTISQPYIVALMTEALRLRPDEDVLEIGTGSGYAAAALSDVARRVYTIERHAELAEGARARPTELGADPGLRRRRRATGWTSPAAVLRLRGPPVGTIDNLQPTGSEDAPGRGSAAAIEFLLVRLGATRIAVPLSVVSRVAQAAALTPAPGHPDLVGVCNLGGVLVPILDVRRHFAVTPRPIAVDDVFVILVTRGRLIGLVADAALGTARWPLAALIEATAISPTLDGRIRLAETGDGAVVVLDPDAFLSEVEAQAVFTAASP